jgi:hypothetical protein
VRDSKIRDRLQAAGSVAAFAFVVGLAAPAAGIVEPATDGTDAAQTETVAGGAATMAAATSESASAGASTSAPTTSSNPMDAVQASVAEAADAVASAVAPAPAAPTEQELHPVEITAAQQQFTPTTEQLRNAKAIVDAGKEMGLPPRAWTIAVATSLQESNLRNLGHLGAYNDHDSLGLFQQRPSTGWGTPEQIQDPDYAAKAFYRGLVQVPDWDRLPLTVAAQKVQVSAYPNHYAKHEVQAGDIVEALHGTGPYADLAADVR